MSDEALRLRLEALNRGALPVGPLTPVRRRLAPVHSAECRVARPAAEAASPYWGAWRSGTVKANPGLVRRGEVMGNDAGEHLGVCLSVDEVWPGGEELVRRRCAVLAETDAASDAKPTSGGSDWLKGFPDSVLFLDLETCGLAGSALFLAGVLRPVNGRLCVELLLARDYSEESAVLASLWQRLADIASIVTFNGKSFDWPMVVDRSRRHLMGRGATAPPRHVDLLHLARRQWRGELPDCKLQTLERHICGRTRADDMPSNQIPAAYHEYVRTGFEREMDAILLHNAVDLVTMLDLAMRLAGGNESGNDIVTSRSVEASGCKSAKRTARRTSG